MAQKMTPYTKKALISIGVLALISIVNYARLQNSSTSGLEDFQKQIESDPSFAKIKERRDAEEKVASNNKQASTKVASSYIEKNLEALKEILWKREHDILGNNIRGSIELEGKKDTFHKGKIVLVPPQSDDPREGELQVKRFEVRLHRSPELGKLLYNKNSDEREEGSQTPRTVKFDLPAKAFLSFDPENTFKNYIVPCTAEVVVTRMDDKSVEFSLVVKRGDITVDPGSFFNASGDNAKDAVFYISHNEQVTL